MLTELSSAEVLVANSALLILLSLAAVYDLRTRRIPNRLVLLGILVASLFAGFAGGKAILWGAMGLSAALAVFYPIYAAGWLGAGDVKLMGLVGGFFGLQQLLPVMGFVALAGGVLTVAYLLFFQASSKTRKVPYAVAILTGVVVHLWFYTK